MERDSLVTAIPIPPSGHLKGLKKSSRVLEVLFFPLFSLPRVRKQYVHCENNGTLKVG